jgi:acetyl-CoA carboxylase biotin carboxyl carrier protein
MSMKDAKAQIASPRGHNGEAGSVADMVRELAELLSETNLTEIEVEQNGQRVRVSRQMSAVMTQAMPTAAAPAAIAPAGGAPQKAAGPQAGTVTSPMVGTVYLAPEPGKPPFVKVGDTVKEGDTLLIVEAMKTMNPILAPRSGTVREICISDAEPVEFGQPLLVIA